MRSWPPAPSKPLPPDSQGRTVPIRDERRIERDLAVLESLSWLMELPPHKSAVHRVDVPLDVEEILEEGRRG